MNQITVRNVTEKARSRAREVAAKRGLSLNRVYLQAIEKGLGIEPTQERHSNLEAFAGDSDFGPEWERFLSTELNRIDAAEWQWS